jgi:hypothetical protein
VAGYEAEAKYANYLQVGQNAFEFLLELGQAYGNDTPAVHTRVITSPYYAKAFLKVLEEAVATYERSFGPIQTEVGSE